MPRDARVFCLRLQVLRKERAVGVIPQHPTVYEVLEELTITLQIQLGDQRPVPFCAFNGGNDVFCDVGTKAHGLEALMSYVGCRCVAAPGC